MRLFLLVILLQGVPCRAGLIMDIGRKPPGNSPYREEFMEAAKEELRNGRKKQILYQELLGQLKKTQDIDSRRTLGALVESARMERDDAFTRAVLWTMKAYDLEIENPPRTILVPGPHEGMFSTWRVLVQERQSGGDGPFYEHSVEARPKPLEGVDGYRNKALKFLGGVARSVGLTSLGEWADKHESQGPTRYLRYFSRDDYDAATSYDGLTVIHSEMLLRKHFNPDAKDFRSDVLASTIYHERMHFEDRVRTDDCSQSLIECEKHALGMELAHSMLLGLERDYENWVRERFHNTEKYYPQFKGNPLPFSPLEDMRVGADIQDELARINRRADALRASVEEQVEERKRLAESRRGGTSESSEMGERSGDSSWMPQPRPRVQPAPMPVPAPRSYAAVPAPSIVPYCVELAPAPTALVDAASRWCADPQGAGTWDPFLPCVTRYSSEFIAQQTTHLGGCAKALAAELMSWNNDIGMRRPTAEGLRARIRDLTVPSPGTPSGGDADPGSDKGRSGRPCRKGVWSKQDYDLPDC